MQLHRRWWVALAGVTVASLALLGAYAAALARLPQQRAALESLIRAQTGFDVRFGSLSLRLGLYGPEAHFTAVTLSLRDSGQPLLQATELVARFETWRMLRGGALRPGRILVIGARIDARQLRDAALRRRAAVPAAIAATPEQRRLAQLAALARSLPAGRLEFESATLLGLEAATRADAARAIRIPRLAVERDRGQARVHGTALLADALGRTLYFALELRGLEAAPTALEGTLIAQGRALRLAGWQSLLAATPAAAAAVRTGAAGVADLRVVLWVRSGQLQSGSVTLAARDLSFMPQGSAARARVPMLSGSALLRRTASGWSAAGSDLRLQAPGAPAATLEWRAQVDASLRHATLAVPEAPLGWLQPLAGLPAELRLAGTLQQLELGWEQGAAQPWRYVLRSDDAAWLDAAGVVRFAPFAFALRGDTATARLDLTAADATLMPTGAATAWPLSARGRIDIVRSASGWRLAGDALQVAERADGRGRPRFEVDATLAVAARGDAALDLAVRVLEPADSTAMPWLGALAERVFAAESGARLGAFTIAGGRFALRAQRGRDAAWQLEDSRGELAISAADFRPDREWPAVNDAGGRLRWDARSLRFEFERGDVGGLRLLRGALERGATPRWTFTLDGPVDAALATLRASPLGARMPREFGSVALRGRARFDVSVAGAPAGVAATGGAAASGAAAVTKRQRWLLTARFDALQWRPLEGVAPVERIAGTLRLVGGALQPLQLDGIWSGQPLRIAFEPRRAARRWQISGRWPGPLPGDLLGDAPEASRDGVAWRVDAQPASAAADRWRIDASAAGQRLRSVLEARADAAGAFELVRGVVQVGRPAARVAALRLPEGRELRVGGALPRMELVGLTAAWGAVGPTLARLPPLTGTVAIEQLSVLGEAAGSATLRWDGSDAAAGGDALRLRGAQVEGRLPVVAAANARPQLLLSRLQLQALPGLAALRSTPADADWSGDVSVEALQVAERPLGAVQARIVSTAGRFALEELRWRIAELRISGRLDCLRLELRCDASGELGGGGARAALATWGIPSGFDAARLDGSLQLSWPVAAAADAWAALDGELHLRGQDGTLQAPVTLGLAAADARDWRWQDFALDGRIGAGRLELTRVALEGEQQLSLAGGVSLPDGVAELQGTWLAERAMPKALERWPAAPALAALWRGLRGDVAPPQPVRVIGRFDALEMQRAPLQSAPPP